MSRIEQLIEELCPDGVEYKELGEVMNITRGASPRPINNFITNDEDGVPWIKIGDVNPQSKFITQTKEKITKEGAEKSRYLKKGDFVLSNSMSFGRPYILKIDGCIHDGWISMQNFENVLIADFLYYLLSSDVAQKYWKQKASSGTVQNLNADIIRATKVPIPPLPIQQEIVTILDTFTALDGSLQAELEARRKQYEHYRNQLLNFEGKEVEWKMLGEIGNIQRGVRVVRNQLLESGKYPVYQNSMKPLGYFDKKNFKANTTFIISAGAAGDIGYSDVDFWAADDCFLCLCPDNLKSKFLYYFLLCNQNYLYSRVRRASVPRLSRDVVEKIKIPLPPLSEQERIVGILDKFDALVNTELPAEIAARRKQYEYYREKLLTFEPLAN